MLRVLHIVQRIILAGVLLSITACASGNAGPAAKVMNYKKSRCECSKQMKELVNHAR
ncbi:MAG: hypothetical protein J0G32_03805 [Alphaproteobacteria bacterium]|nr:hypothetical protein [Alphaproteobacteria bacterium]